MLVTFFEIKNYPKFIFQNLIIMSFIVVSIIMLIKKYWKIIDGAVYAKLSKWYN